MKKKTLKNIGASVRQRLLNISREKSEEFQYNLTRYAVERFLFRFSKSEYSKQFILKGALLFLFWGTEQHRQTRDVDFLGFGENNISILENIFKDICNVTVEEDGFIFHENSVKGELIRNAQEYGGIRIFVDGILSTAKVRLQFDIGFGDSVTPSPVEAEMPVLLNYPG